MANRVTFSLAMATVDALSLSSTSSFWRNSHTLKAPVNVLRK